MPEIQPDELLRALKNDELEFFYQPKVSFLTGRVCGCEALVRWRQADGSLLYPGSFLPMAEKAGLITEVAMQMFPVLCRDHMRLSETFGSFQVAFNLNAHDLESEKLVNLILEAVRTGLILPQQIQVELTETAVASDESLMRRNLDRMIEAGVALAMDDFGTGYSSLDALHRLPFSVVKIDQAVVNGLTTSGRCAAIVLASIRMAHEMKLKVVAEGVESEEVFEYLLHAGCTEAQGFWISEALPLPAFIEFVAQGRRWSTIPIGLLRHVEIDHIQWRKAIMDQVLGHRPAGLVGSLRGIEISPFRCRFGEWYHGIGRDFAGLPQFDALDEPHRRLHQIGAELLRAAADGSSETVLRELTSALNDCSEEVLRRLQDLEITALLQESRIRN